jgi:thiosulfate/3-mercaptopyruvate sulfurtransferase
MKMLKEADAPLPDTFPLESTVRQHLRLRNVGLDSKVVCYDQGEGNWAARAAIILTAYGHGQVYVLDGGLKNWIASGKETSKDSNGTTNICENFDYKLCKD